MPNATGRRHVNIALTETSWTLTPNEECREDTPYLYKRTPLVSNMRTLDLCTERTSNLSVTKYLAKKYTSGLMLSNNTGTVTAAEAAQRNRVTGGILRISCQRDMLLSFQIDFCAEDWERSRGGLEWEEIESRSQARVCATWSSVDEITCDVCISFLRDSRTFQLFA